MREAGQIALVPFPFADSTETKLRPVLLLRRASVRFDDWLVCMISSQLHQAEPHLDEILAADDSEFAAAGLKAPSVLRLARLAVINNSLIAGTIGQIGAARLDVLRQRLAEWLVEPPSESAAR